MGRTAFPSGTGVPYCKLAEAPAAAGVLLRGLHAYDGHLADTLPAARREEVLESSQAILEVGLPVEELAARDHPLAPALDELHRVTPQAAIMGFGRSRDISGTTQTAESSQ